MKDAIPTTRFHCNYVKTIGKLLQTSIQITCSEVVHLVLQRDPCYLGKSTGQMLCNSLLTSLRSEYFLTEIQIILTQFQTIMGIYAQLVVLGQFWSV